MTIASFYDTKGKLWVDCTECTKGFYGGNIDKCGAGGLHQSSGLGCFIGIIMPKYEDLLKEKINA